MAKTRNDPARKNRRREKAKQRAAKAGPVGHCRFCMSRHDLDRFDKYCPTTKTP